MTSKINDAITEDLPGCTDEIFIPKPHQEILSAIVTLLTRQKGSGTIGVITGQNGTGKTWLMGRVSTQIRTDHALSGTWLPIEFLHESYHVCSPAEFWLEALLLTASSTGLPELQSLYEELRYQRNEAIVHSRAYDAVTSSAVSKGKKLLFLVENIDMLLTQFSSKSQLKLFAADLMRTECVGLVGTATPPQDSILFADAGLSRLFRRLSLPGLDYDDAFRLWKTFSCTCPDRERFKAVYWLTRGIPGTLSMFAETSRNHPHLALGDLTRRVIQGNLPFYKPYINSLPPLERKVFVALALLWDPSTARQIAASARIDVNKASAYLQRLTLRGIVAETEKQGRKKWYQLTDRWVNYSILELMKREGAHRFSDFLSFLDAYGNAGRHRFSQVQELFMTLSQPSGGTVQDSWADTSFCVQPRRTHCFTPEKAPLEGDEAEDIQETKDLLTRIHDIEKQISEHPEAPTGWFNLGGVLMDDPDRQQDAEAVFQKTLALAPGSQGAWFNLGLVLSRRSERFSEALRAYEKAQALSPDSTDTWINIGCLYASAVPRQAQAAETAFQKAVGIDPDSSDAWYNYGILLALDASRAGEAEAALKKSIKIKPAHHLAWLALGRVLLKGHGRYQEASVALTKAIETGADDPGILLDLLECQLYLLNFDNAEKTARAYLELAGRSCDTLTRIALLMGNHPAPELLSLAAALASEAASIPDSPWVTWFAHAVILGRQGRWTDSLDLFRKRVPDIASGLNYRPQLIRYLLDAAFAGYGETVLCLADHENLFLCFEPVFAGIRHYCGKPCRSAWEINEIGIDIANALSERATGTS